MKFFVCVVVFAATSVTILSGRPTENDGTLIVPTSMGQWLRDDRMKQLQKMEQLNWILSHPRPRRSGCVRRTGDEKDCHSRQQLRCQQQQQRAASRRCGIPTTCL